MRARAQSSHLEAAGRAPPTVRTVPQAKETSKSKQ